MKKAIILLLCASMLGTVGCLEKKKPESKPKTIYYDENGNPIANPPAKDGETQPPVPTEPTTPPPTAPEGIFDVDVVRQNIYIKGQLIDLPKKLGEFPAGWTYTLYDRKEYNLKEGSGLAKMYYCGEEMGTVMLEDCYDGKEAESTAYSISTHEENSNIYGITPHVSTVDDVKAHIGEPDEEFNNERPFEHSFRYGISEGEDEKGVLRANMLSVSFDEDGVVDLVSVYYSRK
ncbi:hypothetical protein [Ruminococcus flavefaciens]|uniref:hypothetical protein n=1 Tax=Ruminococcus flavefaciens TaxID=1265 RepID=UPI0026ED9E12|nr:hypothetical protein [Ruminococcus flavefaciens]